MAGMDYVGAVATSLQGGTDRINIMKRVTVLLRAMAIAAIAMVPVTARAEEMVRNITLMDGVIDQFTIAPGHVLTINTDIPVAEIVPGNVGVADVYPLTDTSIYIQGKASGFTNIALYNAEKTLLGVINVRVRLDFSELQSVINRAVPSAQISVNNVNNRVELTGEVRDNVDHARVLELARQYTDDPIVDAVRVRSGQQVQLDVRILEVARNAGRELGVDLNAGDLSINGASNATPFGNIVGNIVAGAGINADVVINALEAKTLARRLANPQLVTTSGIEANFVVGGEVPITRAVIGENGNTAEETAYRDYGVRLNFRPEVLDNDLIQLRIRPEVSSIDENYTAGTGFTSRKADTTVTLRDGQSYAIAGLLQASNSRNIEQMPWLGQVPILGALFRSTDFQKRETDLVIIVTPHLVRPASPDEPLRSPLDNTRSSNDVELFLLGMLEVDRDLIRSFAEGAGVIGPYGHMIDLEFEDGLIAK